MTDRTEARPFRRAGERSGSDASGGSVRMGKLLLLAAVLSLGHAHVAAAAERNGVQNLIRNPSFDSGRTGWAWSLAGGKANVVEVPGPLGRPGKALRLRQDSSIRPKNSVVQQVKAIEGGRTYRMTVWYRTHERARPARGEYVLCWLTLYPGQGGARWVQLAGSAAPGAWKKLEQTFTTRADFGTTDKPGRIQVELLTYSELDSVCYDEVTLVEVPTQRSPESPSLPQAAAASEKRIAAGKGGEIAFYVLRPITNEKILPDFPPVPDKVSHQISLVLCPGEYEPASFVVHAINDVSGLEVEAGDLKSKTAAIAASNIDIRVVKCWYQSSQDTSTKVGRFLLPELLLKDDSLVRVDHVSKENHLKLRYPDGDRYVAISREDGVPIPGISTIPTPDRFPVRDSEALLPVSIPTGTNKQFWITLKAPDDAAPGIYRGSIVLRADNRLLGKLSLRVRVLPFGLLPPYYTSSILYDGRIHPEGKDLLGYGKRPPEQLRRELENLYAHGVRNPKCSGDPGDQRLLTEHLRLRSEVGMENDPLYLSMSVGNPTSKEDLDALKKRVKAIVDFCRERGTSGVYFYGIDEATGEKLKSQRAAWRVVHEAGGKIYVAGYSIHDEDIAQGNFELMGDIQDLLICAHRPRRDEAAKWHSKGHRICCYANPQFGIVKPETYRRNYGLLLWQNDYDGAMNFNYYTGGGPSWGNVWNDFDGQYYNDHNMVYPTTAGVIDTVQWEGYREGVDDVRYLTSLLDAIGKARKSDIGERRSRAMSADAYLKELKDADLRRRSLDTVRLELARHILDLQRAPE